MPVPMMPAVTVSKLTMDTLVAAGLPASTGVADLTFRWRRNRYTTAEERNCLSLAFVGDRPRDPEDTNLALGETMRELQLDLIADIELPTEVAVEEADTEDDYARLQILMAVLMLAVRALKRSFTDPAAAPTPLTPWAMGVEEVVTEDDEDLADINGRLVSRINVLYRVRSEDPTVLLGG